MLCWCRHPTPKASSRSRSAWKLAGKIALLFRHSVSSAKPTCSSQRNEPAMGFPRRFADDFQDVSKDKAGKPPSNLRFLRKKNPTVQPFTPGIQGRWMKTTSLHQTRVTKKESSWKYCGKLMEILWTYSSSHISSTLYLVLSVHRKCCK